MILLLVRVSEQRRRKTPQLERGEDNTSRNSDLRRAVTFCTLEKALTAPATRPPRPTWPSSRRSPLPPPRRPSPTLPDGTRTSRPTRRSTLRSPGTRPSPTPRTAPRPRPPRPSPPPPLLRRTTTLTFSAPTTRRSTRRLRSSSRLDWPSMLRTSSPSPLHEC